MIVDSHCHASSRWYEPAETLLFNMDRCGVDKAVLVQMLGSTSAAEMVAACAHHPDRFAHIGTIDPSGPDPRGAIARAAEQGAVGLRLRAHWRSAGEDPLALWRWVGEARLGVSMVGPVDSFTDGKLAEIAAAVPGLAIVLEHLGGLARPDASDRARTLPDVCALARYPNISLKLPGLGQIARRLDDPEAAAVPLDLNAAYPLVDAIAGAFSPERLMWGSDFPPVAAREGYRNALEWVRELVSDRWPHGVQACLGETARSVFRL